MDQQPAGDQYRAMARADYHGDGETEIDADAQGELSAAGAYVQAWVWVAGKAPGEDEEPAP